MEANDGRTLTMVTICYQLLGRLLERSVIGPELSRNDQKAPSLQEGEKKKKVQQIKGKMWRVDLEA